MKRLIVVALTLLSICCTPTFAQTKKAPAKKSAVTAPARPKGVISQNPYIGAVILDADSGDVLFSSKPDVPGYPASTLKLMTLLLTLEKIDAGQAKLTDPVPVSVKACKTGGSQIYLDPKETFTLEDLLYALMIQSANDAAVAIAEFVAGSTEAFVEQMNAKAQQLGMKNTRFSSVHGLPPSAGERPDISTARDMAILSRELCRHPATFTYTAAEHRQIRQNTPKPFDMRTHNPFIKPSTKMAGCDGLKTGYTATAGYSIAVTCKRNNRRIIVYVLGSMDRKVRDAQARELVNKGFTLLNERNPAPVASEIQQPSSALPPPPPPAAPQHDFRIPVGRE